MLALKRGKGARYRRDPEEPYFFDQYGAMELLGAAAENDGDLIVLQDEAGEESDHDDLDISAERDE